MSNAGHRSIEQGLIDDGRRASGRRCVRHTDQITRLEKNGNVTRHARAVVEGVFLEPEPKTRPVDQLLARHLAPLEERVDD